MLQSKLFEWHHRLRSFVDQQEMTNLAELKEIVYSQCQMVEKL